MKNKIKIPDVTLLAISSTEEEGSIKSLVKCCEQIEFGNVKFVSHKKPESMPDFITWEYCPQIKSFYDFDCYVFPNIGNHIQTSHMLMVQSHAWIIHAELWDDNWLQYDFIGSPWVERSEFISFSTGEMVRVGNGGFSLRSKKILDLPQKLNLPVVSDRGYTSDDGLLNSYYRKIFLENGINYPDVHIASRFAFENIVSENIDIVPFGFHKFLPPWNK